jgi:membrane-bound metal-dependent hydrolase YbcI (DUF457 family)
MSHTVAIWLLVAAFLGAGLVNAIGAAGTRDGYVRWGYPAWWGRLTGALEIVVAVLVAVPVSRGAGLVFGAVIIAAAVLTVLRHREFSHLAPLSVFAALIAVVAFASSGWST